MTDKEYVKRIGQLYNKVMKLKDDRNYVINEPQMDKLIEVLNFFQDTAYKCGGKVEPTELIPKEEHGGVTATFLVFDVYGEDIKRFSKAISYTSAITIDSCDEGVCISVTIPEVFKPIDKVVQ